MLRRYYIFNTFLVLIFCVVYTQTTLFSRLSNISLDTLFKFRGELNTSQEIVIVGIDEESLEELGSWPFTRKYHAILLDRLKYAKVIGFDLLFAQKTREDIKFAKAIENGPLIVFAVAENYQGKLIHPPRSFSNLVSFGHIDSILGNDGVVRKVEIEKYGFKVLSLAMLAPELVRKETNKGEVETKTINFYGPEFTFLYVPYNKVINGFYDEDFFRDRYVLVGAKAIALGDVHITPFSRRHPVPGVEIQATILNNFLDNTFISEIAWLKYCFCLLILCIAFWVWPKQREAKNIILVAIILLLICLSAAVIFISSNMFCDPAFPVLVLCLSYFLHILVQLIWLTAKLIKEIKQLDHRLTQGLQDFYQTVPTQLKESSTLLSAGGAIPGGIKRYVWSIHTGISVLSLQNSFINHLLNRETPPLILWQKKSGSVVFANKGFLAMWSSITHDNESAPDLDQFFYLLEKWTIDEKQNFEEKHKRLYEKNSIDIVVDICVSSSEGKKYFRVVIHEVHSDILGFSGMIASFTDVTEIKNLEKMKGEMMNIVSHELKLPLTSIIGFGEMLSEKLTGEEEQFAKEICKQSNKLAQMIEDFLDISRIESGRYTINKYAFDLEALIHDAVSCTTHMAAQKNITIDSKIPLKISPLLGDEVLITQAVINLLDNAVKFSPLDSEVEVTLEEFEEEILLKVADQGPGISKADRIKIFEKFVRSIDQKEVSGFGLGLNFVKQVVENHDGQIAVQDNDNGGSIFIISLPKLN